MRPAFGMTSMQQSAHVDGQSYFLDAFMSASTPQHQASHQTSWRRQGISSALLLFSGPHA